MAREIFFTEELVRSSPSERVGNYIVYRTPFGIVREHTAGCLELNHQDEWVELERYAGQLLLRKDGMSVGLPAKTVYRDTQDYLLSKLREYWWVFPLLLGIAGITSIFNVSRIWMSGVFVLTLASILYREHKESGLRRFAFCLGWASMGFLGLAVSADLIYSILHGLQFIMGLCDGTDCGPIYFWLFESGADPSAGRGRYGI